MTKAARNALLVIAMTLLAITGLLAYQQRRGNCAGEVRGRWENEMGEYVVTFGESGQPSARQGARVRQVGDQLANLGDTCGGWWPTPPDGP